MFTFLKLAAQLPIQRMPKGVAVKSLVAANRELRHAAIAGQSALSNIGTRGALGGARQ